MAFTNLTNHFLIAMPALKDPNFEKSVTYICEHSDEGAMGIVINNPLSIPVREILDQLDIDENAPGIPDSPIYLGGPVNGERGFVLHDSDTEWESTLRVKDGISVTTSRDILESIASGNEKY